MKNRFGWALFLVMVMAYFIAAPHTAAAQQAQVSYLGEICFTLEDVVAGNPLKTLQLGILSYGAGHYALHGRIITSGGFSVAPVLGTALIGGDSVYATLTATGGTVNAATYSLILPLDGKAGLYYAVDIYQVSLGPPPVDTDVRLRIERGTVKSIPCP